MSIRRAGRLVRSTMTVTHRWMPRWDQQCSSTPIVDTPSNRVASASNNVVPRSRTAVHTVFHEVARFCAITWILILSMTTDFNAHRRAVRESFDRPTQAFAGDCDQRWRQFGHWNVRMRMARVTAVSPTGGWTSRRILVDRTRPRWAQPGHSACSSASRHNTVKCRFEWCWPMAVRPSSVRLSVVSRHGGVKWLFAVRGVIGV